MRFMHTFSHGRCTRVFPSFMLTIGIMAILVCAGTGSMQAQTGVQFNLKRLVNLWPTIELYYTVACNGQPEWFTDKSHVHVTENGTPVQDFTMFCPDATFDPTISVCLAIDRSASMAGANLAGVKEAANAFVDYLNGVVDEVSVITFDNTVLAIVDPMTPDKTVLHNAITSITPGSAGTVLWDAGYAAVQQTITGSNPCRAVILVTDGFDSASSHAWDDMVTLAQRNRIHIFTVGIGSSVDSASLAKIALLTGGRFYLTPSPSELVAIYHEIEMIIFEAFQECIMTYQATGMDGSLRRVDLTVSNFCSGTDTKSKTYRSPCDTSAFSYITVTSRDVAVEADRQVSVPLSTPDPVPGTMIYPVRFEITLDPAVGRIDSVYTRGTLLNGARVVLTPISNGMGVETLDAVRINGPGVLFTVAITAVSAAGTSATRAPLMLRNWSTNEGCLHVRPQTQGIIVAPEGIAQYIIVQGDTSFCPGDSVQLTASGSFLTHAWSNGDTTTMITVRKSGTYFFSGTDQLGAAYVSPAVHVTVRAAIAQITRKGDTLTCTPAAHYQWSYYGITIPGATHRTLTITLSGVYTVSVIDSLGCTGTSQPMMVVGIEHTPVAVRAMSVTVHPEPNSGAVTVHLARKGAGPVELSVYDVLGRLCHTERHDIAPATWDVALDLTALPRGLYFCRVASGRELQTVGMTKW